ncbi:MAG: type II secretion system protein [Parasporobacterium sp.]|nr:type II secretion system protein [Parasporobacterium sp.]
MKNLMKKLRKKGGFTLAELLIVVAIIAVLVAIAIPIFTTQLEKSREATDIANVRSAYADLVAEYITTGSDKTMSVTAKQAQTGWQGESGVLMTQIDGKESSVKIPDTHINGDSYIIKIEGSGKAAASVTIQ